MESKINLILAKKKTNSQKFFYCQTKRKIFFHRGIYRTSVACPCCPSTHSKLKIKMIQIILKKKKLEGCRDFNVALDTDYYGLR